MGDNPAAVAVDGRAMLTPMPPTKSPATWADLEAMLEGSRGEIVDGVLVVPPRPDPIHAVVQTGVTFAIGGPFEKLHRRGGPGGWWILPEVNVRLAGDQIVHPDVAGWRRERLPRPGHLRPIDVRPDWVCEILSPSNARHDRVTKRRLYAAHGVPHYWLIDPASRSVEVLALDGTTWREVGVFTDGDRASLAPFEAVVLDVAELLPPLDFAAAEPLETELR